MSKNPETKCQNPECEVAESGKCVEGFSELSDCPHYGIEPKKVGSVSKPDLQTKLTEVKVHIGEALDFDQAREILAARGGRVVAIVGPNESGKTTLISSLYDIFQQKPFEKFSFAGSRTLPAFEELCHKARAASERASPTQEHTRIGAGLKFFHLAVISPLNECVDILLSDRSGEDYQAATNNNNACKDLIEISRADLVMVLVDGEKLVNLKLRQSVIGNTKLLCEALFDSDLIGLRHRLTIVLTKYDLIIDNAEKDNVLKAFQKLVDWINEQFSTRIFEIKSFEIAACPQKDTIQAGTGLVNILKECVKPKPILVNMQAVVPNSTRTFNRQWAELEK